MVAAAAAAAAELTHHGSAGAADRVPGRHARPAHLDPPVARRPLHRPWHPPGVACAGRVPPPAGNAGRPAVDPELLVKANAGAQLAGGAMLIVGFVPRLASLVLSTTVISETLVKTSLLGRAGMPVDARSSSSRSPKTPECSADCWLPPSTPVVDPRCSGPAAALPAGAAHSVADGVEQRLPHLARRLTVAHRSSGLRGCSGGVGSGSDGSGDVGSGGVRVGSGGVGENRGRRHRFGPNRVDRPRGHRLLRIGV